MKTILPADISWKDFGAKEIKQITPKIKKLLKEYKTKSLKIKKDDLSFSNFMHLGEEYSFLISRIDSVLFPVVNLHTDKKIRDLGMKVELELSKILSEFAYDEEMYKQFKSYYELNFQKEKSENILTVEEIKIVEDSKIGYEKMGMHLAKKDKKKLLNIKNKINKLAQEYDVNTTKNYEIGIFFSKDKLGGISEDYIKSFKYDEKKKKFWVNCSGRDDIGTDYPIIKKYCTVKETREKVTFLNESSVGEKNNKKLREILKLRNEIIKMLGQKNWSNFVVKEEMMNEPKKIVAFLKSLIEKLTPQYLTEKSKIEILLKERGEKLTTASYAFGKNLLSKKDSSINEDLYKPYFELNSVLSVLFKTWENLFDIKAEFIKDVKILHEDTLFYKFTDTKSGDLLGHGILDLHPRTGKYGHACVADIFKKYESMDDKKHAGLTYLICNFKKVVEGKTFITISDMNTLYHEAGHMLHMILMKNKYISTSSTSRDFVEIPSQFHENFLLNKNFVAENFRHFETGEKMPKDLVNNLDKIGKKGESHSWIRTSLASLFDQEIHSNNILKYSGNKNSIDNLFESLWKKYLKYSPVNKNRHFPSAWEHLVGGYDARYYSYVISKVYSVDFWQAFSKGGIKKGKMSEKYKKFLEAAATKDEKDIVFDFLGREVDQKPFLDSIK